jgi:GT2 family glycosyltransferase
MQPTVYIPNLNQVGHLRAALRSVAGGDPSFTVAVVDNGSSDGSPEMVRDEFPAVELIALGENLGFSRALNRAVREVPGDPIVLLNNDVECAPGFIAAITAAGDGQAMVAGLLVQRSDPGLIDSAGVIADDSTLLAFDHLHGEPVAAAETAPPPLGPSGGAALYPRAAFEEAGGFDERMFAYYEDFDLALRLAAAGVECRLAPAARALHHGSMTLGSRSGDKYALTGWGRGYMLRRYGVLRGARGALRSVACDLAICAGQVALDRTLKGARGRLSGWRAGTGLPARQIPHDRLDSLPVRTMLARRARRHAV